MLHKSNPTVWIIKFVTGLSKLEWNLITGDIHKLGNSNPIKQGARQEVLLFATCLSTTLPVFLSLLLDRGSQEKDEGEYFINMKASNGYVHLANGTTLASMLVL